MDNESNIIAMKHLIKVMLLLGPVAFHVIFSTNGHFTTIIQVFLQSVVCKLHIFLIKGNTQVTYCTMFAKNIFLSLVSHNAMHSTFLSSSMWWTNLFYVLTQLLMHKPSKCHGNANRELYPGITGLLHLTRQPRVKTCLHVYFQVFSRRFYPKWHKSRVKMQPQQIYFQQRHN